MPFSHCAHTLTQNSICSFLNRFILHVLDPSLSGWNILCLLPHTTPHPISYAQTAPLLLSKHGSDVALTSLQTHLCSTPNIHIHIEPYTLALSVLSPPTAQFSVTVSVQCPLLGACASPYIRPFASQAFLSC